MAGIMKRGPDNLMNGSIAGAIAASLVIFGETVKGWATDIIPVSWIEAFPEGYGLGIILISAGALIGYIIDRQ